MAPDRSEVSLKIRSAIKAKLEELGVYVDDELPDYIMVMVANKKSPDGMTEDLRLFLGRSAPVFTKWFDCRIGLSNILERLHAISKGSDAKAKEADPAAAADKEKSSSKSDKKHHKKDKKKEKSSKDKDKKSTTKRSSDRLDEEKTSHHSKTKKPRKEEPLSPPKTAHRDRSPTDTKKLAGDMVAASVMERPAVQRMNHDEDDDDGLPLGADYSSVQPTSQKPRPISPKREPIKSATSAVDERKRNVVRVKPIMKQETTEEQTTDRNQPADQRRQQRPAATAGVFMRALSAVNRTSQQQPAPAQIIRSTVQPRRTVETVDATTVVVKEEPSAKQQSESEGVESDGAGSEASERKRHRHKKHRKHSRHKSKRRVERRSDKDEEENGVAAEVTGGTAATRRVELKETDSPAVVKEEPPAAADDVHIKEDTDTLVIGLDESAAAPATQQVTRPKFVVTMDGLPDSFLSRLDSTGSRSHHRVAESRSPPPPAVTQTGKTRITGPEDTHGSRIRPIVVHRRGDGAETMDTGSRPHSAQSQRTQQSDHQQQQRRSHSPPAAQASGSSGDLVLMMQPSQQSNAEESLMPMQVIHPPISISLDDDDDDMNDSFSSQPTYYLEPEVEHPETSDSPDQGANAKIPERCRFWPECNQGDACSYTHPTTKCKSFPNCAFLDKCLYLHPLCRFDSSCTRPGCTFTHTAKARPRRPTAPTAAPAVYHPPKQHYQRPDVELDKLVKSYAPLPVPCRFGGHCTKYDTCPFKHPKMCMYGVMCPSTHCAFMHPGGGPPPAVQQKLKHKAAAAALKTTKVNVLTKTITTNRVANPQPLVDTSRFKWTRGGGGGNVLKSPNSQKSPVAAVAAPPSLKSPSNEPPVVAQDISAASKE